MRHLLMTEFASASQFRGFGSLVRFVGSGMARLAGECVDEFFLLGEPL